MIGKRIKLISIFIAITIVVLLIILWIIDLNRSVTLNVLVTPLDATISINGKKYTNGTYRFFPGKVSVKIEHNRLDTKEYDLELEPSTTTLLYDYLTYDGDFSYYTEHGDDYNVLKFVYDDAALDFINKQEMVNSIIDILPLRISKYAPIYMYETIVEDASSDPRCVRAVCLKVRADLDDHSISKEGLKDYGYNIDDYVVFYEPE